VRVPTVEQDDDARRVLRDRYRLVKERTAHTNRIKGFLKTQGIMDFDPRAKGATLRLDEIMTGDGRRLGACLKQEIVRELERLSLVMEQLVRVEAERDAVAEMGRQQEVSAADQHRDAAMIAVLDRLKGIGTNERTTPRSWYARHSGATAVNRVNSAAGVGWRRRLERAARCHAIRGSRRRGRRCCGRR
jgi:transposase